MPLGTPTVEGSRECIHLRLHEIVSWEDLLSRQVPTSALMRRTGEATTACGVAVAHLRVIGRHLLHVRIPSLATHERVLVHSAAVDAR